MDFTDILSVLLIEAIHSNIEIIRTHLELMGFAVHAVSNLTDGLAIFDAREFGLVLMHMSDRPTETYRACSAIRARSTVPIIVLADRERHVDEELLLAAGADDYVTTPISARIFTSRVTYQVSRLRSPPPAEKAPLQWGPLTLDPEQHRFEIAGKEVALTNTELRLLRLLIATPRQVFTREQIVDAIGSYMGDGSAHAVDTHLSRLRKKIRANGGPDVISTVRGVGFRLADAPPGEHP